MIYPKKEGLETVVGNVLNELVTSVGKEVQISTNSVSREYTIVTRKNSLETHNTLLFYVFVTIISLEPSFLRAQNFKDVRFKGTFVRKLYKQSISLLVFLEMPGDNCSIYVCTVSRRSKYKGIAIFRVPAPKTEFEKSWKDKLVADYQGN